MKKQILSITILATLPFGAWADNPVVSVGPAAVPSNGTAVVATANPPYQTLTPTNDDKQHIASTAYVKGAYNDSIAAVNKVAKKLGDLNDFVNNDIEYEISEKQDKLAVDETGDEIASNVLTSIDDVPDDDHSYLVTGLAVKEAVDEKQDKMYIYGISNRPIDSYVVGDEEFSDVMGHYGNGDVPGDYPGDRLVTALGVAEGVNEFMANYMDHLQPVTIYTTWDTNNTTNVSLWQ